MSANSPDANSHAAVYSSKVASRHHERIAIVDFDVHHGNGVQEISKPPSPPTFFAHGFSSSENRVRPDPGT